MLSIRSTAIAGSPYIHAGKTFIGAPQPARAHRSETGFPGFPGFVSAPISVLSFLLFFLLCFLSLFFAIFIFPIKRLINIEKERKAIVNMTKQVYGREMTPE